MNDEIRHVVDRAAIHDLLASYAWGIDTWDTERVVGCFTADGRLLSADGTVLASGSEELRAFFDRGRVGGRFGTMGEGRLLSISHTIGSILVEAVDGDRASARSACTATSLAADGDREVLYLHGVRYEDDLERGANGWRIALRRHFLDWVREV